MSFRVLCFYDGFIMQMPKQKPTKNYIQNGVFGKSCNGAAFKILLFDLRYCYF